MKYKGTIVSGALAICVAAALWGLDGVVLTPRLYGVDIALVVFVVHVIPFLLMNFFLFKEYKQIRSFSPKDVLLFFLIAAFGGAIGTLSIVKALFLVNFQALTIVVLLQKLQPIFVISLATIFLKEKLKKNFVLWASIALVAGYFLTFGFSKPNFDTGSNTGLAALYSLLAAFSFGSSTVLSKKVLEKFNYSTATFYRYGFTSVLMFIYVLFAGALPALMHVTNTQWIIFVIIGLTTGSGAIYLYYYGLTKVKAMLATICELCFPVTAVLLDYFINHKILSLVQWISAIIMIFAIVKLSLEKQQE